MALQTINIIKSISGIIRTIQKNGGDKEREYNYFYVLEQILEISLCLFARFFYLGSYVDIK